VLFGVLLCIPVGVIGEALHFGGLAWLAAVMVVGLLASLVDRDGCYGPRASRRGGRRRRNAVPGDVGCCTAVRLVAYASRASGIRELVRGPRASPAPPAVPPLAVVARVDRELPVAVFDSGVGGLTVLHECLVSLPHEDFVYLGDTARFPYGDRTPQELLAFARELAAILLERGAKLLVVACNSATAAALPALSDELRGRLPVVGVVRPESRLAAAVTRNGRVGLIATPATVASGAYARALAEAAPTAELHAVASAELAPLIQEGGEVDHRVVCCVEGLCRPLRTAGVDTVILGCTHYPLVRPVLQRALGRGVAIVSSGEAIADEIEGRLREAGLANDEDRRGDYRFLATGEPEDFRRLGTRFLQLPIAEVEHVELAAPVAGRGAAAA
jgi:glutamate racemase